MTKIAGQAVVLVALVGGTAAYAVNDSSVQLTVDGETQEVHVFGSTVAEVLEAADVAVTDRDVVAPALDEKVDDGAEVVVAHARELTLTLDGETRTHWTTALTVDEALDDLQMRADDAELSASRSTPLGRDGLALEMVTPKDVQVLVDGQVIPAVTTAATVGDALSEMGVTVGPQDRVSVAPSAPLVDGLVVAVTRLGTDELVEEKAVAFPTDERPTDELTEGEREVETPGRVGTRTITYAQVVADGQEVARTVVSDEVTAEPVTQVVLVGTAEPEPEPPAAPAVANGGVWDRLAECESGGNWSINTGNGYYGGLQFSLSTWRAYGGSGMPHENSRAQQIAVAERVQDAQGWGAWPSCSSKLGLR
ncbi:MAG TPA: ubiquitin-like domain-containing protein [Actinomycetales bacterium]|nr:ubiquitin-like domain-containing protein [Actinomycetales bacterium]